MNKNVLVAVGAAVVGGLIVVVYNAVVKPAPPPPGPCPGGTPHCLVVSVITVGGKAQIAPIPDERVDDNGAAIFWEIGTPGYTFPAKGIEFPPTKPAHAAPSGEFNCAPVTNVRFRCIDANSTKGPHAYTVTLEGSPAVDPLDPFIVNH